MRRLILAFGLIFGLMLSPAHPAGAAGSDAVRRCQTGPGARRARARDRAGGGGRAPVAALASWPGAAASTRRRLSLDLSSAGSLERSRSNGGVAHISGDLPVVADIIYATKSRAPTRCGPARAGSSACSRTPATRADGIGVAVIDSGIADHAALAGPRRRARRTSSRTSRASRAIRSATARTSPGMIGGSSAAAARVTTAYRRRQRAGRALRRRARARQQRRRLHQRRHRRHRLGRSPTRDATASASSTCRSAIPSPSRRRPTRSAARSSARCARASSSSHRPATTAGPRRGAPVLGGITSPGNSPLAITVGALDHKGTRRSRRRRVAPYSSRGPTQFDFAVKPDVVAPGAAFVSLESPGRRG